MVVVVVVVRPVIPSLVLAVHGSGNGQKLYSQAPGSPAPSPCYLASATKAVGVGVVRWEGMGSWGDRENKMRLTMPLTQVCLPVIFGAVPLCLPLLDIVGGHSGPPP